MENDKLLKELEEASDKYEGRMKELLILAIVRIQRLEKQLDKN
jgi:hypothetical protein